MKRPTLSGWAWLRIRQIKRMNFGRLPFSSLLAENLFGGIDDADRGIGSAIGAELLGVLDEHGGVDDGLVLVALVPAVHPGQHHLDLVVAALEKLLAGQCRQVENLGVSRHRQQRDGSSEQNRSGCLHGFSPLEDERFTKDQILRNSASDPASYRRNRVGWRRKPPAHPLSADHESERQAGVSDL